MACDAAGWLRERIIASSPAPKVENPEARIDRLMKMEKDGRLDPALVESVREWSRWVLSLLYSEPQPTQYKPPADGLKGGLG